MNRNNGAIYSTFISVLKNKFPLRGELTSFLVDLLYIEKEAIYRRLRGEVPFTFAEVITIAKALNISLDAIMETSSSKRRPFQMKIVEFNNLKEIDFEMVEEFIEIMKNMKNDLISEYGCASSTLPINCMMSQLNIFRFYILKWMYQVGNQESLPVYKDIGITGKHEDVIKKYVSEIKQIYYSCYIVDRMMIKHLVNDINYFYSIRLLKKEDVLLLKENILLLLDRVEKVASDGTFETGKQVQIFISNLNFETNYSYMQSSGLKLAMIRSFGLDEATSLDKKVFDSLKTWTLSLKRTSTLISESGEMQRIRFFDAQRKIVEENCIMN